MGRVWTLRATRSTAVVVVWFVRREGVVKEGRVFVQAVCFFVGARASMCKPTTRIVGLVERFVGAGQVVWVRCASARMRCVHTAVGSAST